MAGGFLNANIKNRKGFLFVFFTKKAQRHEGFHKDSFFVIFFVLSVCFVVN